LDSQKPMRLTYAIGKSDAAAKADGTFKAAQVAARAAARKGRRAGSGRGGAGGEGAAGAKLAAAAGAAPAAAAPPPADAAPPNSTLFVTNLPESTTDSMLSMLFQQFPGFSRTRMVPAKPGIAFVEFETEVAAGVAKSGLHGFKITPEKAMNVEYAKR
jgi:U2 small nuclear ribonucleoprotein B''